MRKLHEIAKDVAQALSLARPKNTDASYMQWRNSVILVGEALETHVSPFDLDEFYRQAGRRDCTPETDLFNKTPAQGT